MAVALQFGDLNMSLITCPSCGEDFEIASANKVIYDFDNLICDDCHKTIIKNHDEFIDAMSNEDWGNEIDDWGLDD